MSEPEDHELSNITTNPDILCGKPIIPGTRISVEFILELIASGATVAEIAQSYPFLTELQIQQAIRYAAKRLENDALLTESVSQNASIFAC